MSIKKISVNKDIHIAKTLPSSYYLDDKYFNLSIKKIFAPSWQIITDSDQFRNTIYPFTFLQSSINEPLLLTKVDDKIYCISNVCTHRGNILCFEKNNSKKIICKYHGRVFDLKGRFLSAPGFEEAKQFPSKIDNLNKIKIRTWKKLIFVSTCSNYGLSDTDLPLNENAELKPLSLYAKQKVEVEKYILSQKNKLDYSPTILRFATAFGLSPRMRFDLTINQFTKSIFENEKLEVYDSNTWRPYCHVKDFARILEKILDFNKKTTNFQVFNVGSNNNNFTKKQIVEKIAQFIPNSKVSFTDKSKDPRNYKVDFSKISKILNIKTEYTVQDGIEEMIIFFKKNEKILNTFKHSKFGNNIIDKEKL